MYTNQKLTQNLKVIGGFAALVSLLLWSDLALAGGGGDLKTITEGLTAQIKSLSGLLIIVAYISGIGFCLAGIVQFKAHKDNPQQVPLSKPIVYLGVGAGLLFLPSIMTSAGSTVFGSGGTVSAGKGKAEGLE